jgi:hypothetical protein
LKPDERALVEPVIKKRLEIEIEPLLLAATPLPEMVLPPKETSNDDDKQENASPTPEDSNTITKEKKPSVKKKDASNLGKPVKPTINKSKSDLPDIKVEGFE